jgi:hypothetical protein
MVPLISPTSVETARLAQRILSLYGGAKRMIMGGSAWASKLQVGVTQRVARATTTTKGVREHPSPIHAAGRVFVAARNSHF